MLCKGNVLNYFKVNLLISLLVFSFLLPNLRIPCLVTGSEDFILLFFTRNFITLPFTFKLMIHFESMLQKVYDSIKVFWFCLPMDVQGFLVDFQHHLFKRLSLYCNIFAPLSNIN
jgi:hypothetical protein